MEHWTNKVIVFEAFSIAELQGELNKFYEEHFVVATQVFPYEYKEGNVNEPEITRVYDAIVYYKIPPTE